ncbi:hypothetical protein NDU88_006724 [Pleurodeles waltl]|uniref:Uncharacterized protein n=1 Tax=Pleurodeles waltl TaxID=8319 RepID=A0AAV7SQE7_PLEWA|nr:hypothetical protein NDU88_006724 [Pleurodeles waltl]
MFVGGQEFDFKHTTTYLLSFSFPSDDGKVCKENTLLDWMKSIMCKAAAHPERLVKASDLPHRFKVKPGKVTKKYDSSTRQQRCKCGLTGHRLPNDAAATMDVRYASDKKKKKQRQNHKREDFYDHHPYRLTHRRNTLTSSSSDAQTDMGTAHPPHKQAAKQFSYQPSGQEPQAQNARLPISYGTKSLMHHSCSINSDSDFTKYQSSTAKHVSLLPQMLFAMDSSDPRTGRVLYDARKHKKQSIDPLANKHRPSWNGDVASEPSHPQILQHTSQGAAPNKNRVQHSQNPLPRIHNWHYVTHHSKGY